MRGIARRAGASRACCSGKEHLLRPLSLDICEDVTRNVYGASPVGLARRSAASADWPGEPFSAQSATVMFAPYSGTSTLAKVGPTGVSPGCTTGEQRSCALTGASMGVWIAPSG